MWLEKQVTCSCCILSTHSCFYPVDLEKEIVKQFKNQTTKTNMILMLFKWFFFSGDILCLGDLSNDMSSFCVMQTGQVENIFG